MAEPRRSVQYEAVTPLVSSRTLQSAAAAQAGSQTVGSSRLPLRRGSISSNDPHAAPGVTMTAGRLPMLRRPSSGDLSRTAGSGIPTVPATVSRLPTRRPSISGGSELGSSLTAPGTASRIGTLKRTSSAAGLQQESELTATKRQLSRALHEIEELKHTHERQSLESTSSTNALQAQLKEYVARMERLERHRALLMGKEREGEEKEKARRSEEDSRSTELQGQVRALRTELSTLRDKHSELGASYRDLEHSAKQATSSEDSARRRVEGLEKELELARREAAESSGEVQQERERRRKVEAELEQEKIHGADAANSEVVREELHRQVSHLRTLEKENGRLVRKLDTYERQHANIEVLKETNKALEKKVRTMDELRSQMTTQEVELEALRREKKDWSAFLGPSDVSEFSSPRKVTKTLAATRIENATFREKLDSHHLELHKRDRIIGELEAQVANLQAELEDSDKALSAAEGRARQDENRGKLLKQEVEMLKRHLESYMTEEAVNQAGNFDEQKTARLAELETLLEAHKHEVSELSKQVGHWRGLVERYGGSTTEIVDLEERESRKKGEDETGVIVSKSLEEQLRLNEEMREELDELRNANELMEQDIDALEQQVASLEEDHGIRGSYNPETTKVLEFRDSPDRVEHAIRTSTLERLRVENRALMGRIAELEGRAGEAAAVELVPKASLVTLQADLQAAKAAVQQKETMLKRISQAVAEKTEAMRMAIAKLLGYQLSFLDSGRIRVTSVYAPSKDRSLAFDPWPGGPTPYKLVSAADEKVMRSGDVRQSINFWLENRSSLPGFMASLTMTLYEETTRGAAGGVVIG